MTKLTVGRLLTGAALVAGAVHFLKRDDREKQSVSAEGRTIHWAHLYDPMVQLFTLGDSARLRRQSADLIAATSGQSVLDFGCGTGDLTRELSLRVGATGSVVGIDAAQEMIERAQLKHGDSAEFRLAPVENLPFEDNSFDVVASSLVMHHLPQNLKEAAIREAYRVLKPGGRFMAIDFVSAENKPTNLIARLHASHNQESDLHGLKPFLMETGYTSVESGQAEMRWLGWLSGTK